MHDFLAQPVLARPEVPLDLCRALAADSFGVDGEISDLGSNQERNFLIRADRGAFVLKIANPAFSDAEVDVQDAALLHLGAVEPDLRIPRPHRSRTGVTVVQFEVSGVPLRARLLDYVEGFALSDVSYLAPVVLSRLGELVGRISAGLTGFAHPGLERTLQWDARSSRAVGELLLNSVTDAAAVTRLRAALHSACDRLDSLAADLRVQPVHGDASDDNVVCSWDRARRAVPDGAIDFGDMSDSWVVGELAATCASVLAHDPARPLALVPVVRAFHARQPLIAAEVEALWPAIVARSVVLVTSGLHQAATDPGNAYATANQHREWSIFESACSLPASVALAALREALALPSPVFALSVAGPLLPSLSEVDVPVVDFSVLSPILKQGAWLEAETAPGLGAAAYGQARLTRTVPDSATEPATVPLGVELFGLTGAPVAAPFAGTLVRSDAGLTVLAGEGVELLLSGVSASATVGSRLAAGAVLGESTDRVFVQLSTEPGLRPPQFVAASVAHYWQSVCPSPEELLGGVGAGPRPLSGPEVVRLRAESFAGVQEHYYAEPPRIERGWRHHLIDVGGRSYLDMINNVALVGHAHPRVTAVAARQWDLLNTNSRFNYLSVAAFSRRLAQLLPDPLDTVFLVNSGSEAVDLALRLARIFTGRLDVVCVAEGYHGWTIGSDAVSTSLQDNPQALATRPDWVHPVLAPNDFRGVHRGPSAGPHYARQARGVIATAVASGRPPGAFIAEALYGNAGGVRLPDGYLASVYGDIREAGGLCIADEVQVGYGRLGRFFWGFEQQGVVPDIVTIAKGMGNGQPLGAVITRRDVADAFVREGYFFSSAGGSPVSCEIGSAVLDVLESEGLAGNAALVGDHLVARLRDLADRHPLIGAVHGMGLYLGVEFVRDHETLEPATEETAAICERLLDLGVIGQPTGDHLNVLKIKPPLCLTMASADFFVAMLDEVLRTGW